VLVTAAELACWFGVELFIFSHCQQQILRRATTGPPMSENARSPATFRMLGAPKRRTFLAVSGAATLAIGAGWEVFARAFGAADNLDQWDADQVEHLLPTVDHQRIRLKVSLKQPQTAPPILAVGGNKVSAEAACLGGRHWVFDQTGLAPGATYQLELRDAEANFLCPAWQLRTFPAPDELPKQFRLLTYTCAGGPDFFVDFRLNPAFLPIRIRRKLLRRAMDLQPDAIIANGDHIYWDRKSRKAWGMGQSPMARWQSGLFDPADSASGIHNRQVIQRGLGAQISGLYRTMMRSCPVFFMQDDHDFFDNDEVIDGQPLFPPGQFHREIAGLTQKMYYPELLQQPEHPARWQNSDKISRYYGTLRFGKLFEGLMYSCRSEMKTGGAGYFVPPDVERWLVRRLAESPSRFVLQFPSSPFLWTAGKWGEWYPDVLASNSHLSTAIAKPHWQKAWQQQHDRLLTAASQHAERRALTVSGDLHASAFGQIMQSGAADFAANPPACLLPGAIGTGVPGWPSSFRGVAAAPSATLKAEEWVAPQERNGFSILDFTAHEVTVSMYGWHPSEGEHAIADLQPFHVKTLQRKPI